MVEVDMEIMMMAEATNLRIKEMVIVDVGEEEEDGVEALEETTMTVDTILLTGDYSKKYMFKAET